MYSTFDRNHKLPVFKSVSPPEVPFWCPLCNCAMGSVRDVESFRSVGTCGNCERDFADSNREAWLGGWRPTSDEVSENLRKRSQFVMDRYLTKRNSDGR